MQCQTFAQTFARTTVDPTTRGDTFMTLRPTRRAAVLAAALAACTALNLPMAAHAQSAKPRVGLVMKSLANEFFKNMTEGAVAYEKKRGDFALKAVGMQSETDFDAQTAAV